MSAQLEHTNYTVADSKKTAAWMCDLFGWHIRWEGAAINGGYTVHVGNDSNYLALFTPKTQANAADGANYVTVGGLNHIAVTVEDIDAMETAVKELGFTPGNHGDYEPGRRFYFHDSDGIEYEVVSYD